MTEFSDDLKKVLAELDKLPTKIEANLVRGALRAAAKPIYTAARERVPKNTGTLRDSIRITGSINTKKGEVLVRVVAGSRVSGGGQKGKTGASRGAFYAHLVEWGVKKHTIKGPIKFGGKVFRNVQHPGAKATPFMRPAFDTSDQKSIDAYAEYMTRNIDKALAKNGLR